MLTRYEHLLQLIDEHKPKSLVEIGVWNGANAIRMIKRALRYNTNIAYTGYDLFEDMTPELDEKEFNVKGHNSVRAVSAYIKAETGIVPNLVKGNTNLTLPPTVADFVFLDGGHSIQTIISDYSAVIRSKVVVLDDFYTPDENGKCPDITKFGCNHLFLGRTSVDTQEKNVVKTIDLKTTILPTKDPVKGGGYTQLVVVCQ